MEHPLTLEANPEAYLEPCQTSKMELFTKIVNGFSYLNIFAKSSISDVSQNSEFASEVSNDLQNHMFARVLKSPLY